MINNSQQMQQEREIYLYVAMAECVKKGVDIESLRTLAYETGFTSNMLDKLLEELK